MKDIKSVIIGFLLATCMFLLMGYTKHKDGHFDTITAKEIIVSNNDNFVRIGDHSIMISNKEKDAEMQIHSSMISQYKQSDAQNSNFLIQGYHNKGFISLYDSEGRASIYIHSEDTEGNGRISNFTKEERIMLDEEFEWMEENQDKLPKVPPSK